ncbi:MAG: Zn-ribbon domain-containing OB-fold protein [Chloroflexota bacterium]
MTDTTTVRPFTAASFDQYLAEGKLMASRCADCGALHLPPRALCPKCHGESLEWVETGGKGRLAGFTVVYIAPTFMIEQGYGRDKPYVSGIVELDEGVKISARITGVDAAQPEAIKVGSPVNVEFIETGEGETRKAALAFRVE